MQAQCQSSVGWIGWCNLWIFNHLRLERDGRPGAGRANLCRKRSRVVVRRDNLSQSCAFFTCQAAPRRCTISLDVGSRTHLLKGSLMFANWFEDTWAKLNDYPHFWYYV